jgi:hypothetical protein
MISTAQEFGEWTSLERRMLEWASPRTRRSATPTRTDLRDPANTVVGISGVSTSGSGLDAALGEFRPLLFGTAWKVIDLLLECALSGLASAKQKTWRIDEKQKHARAFAGTLPGLTDTADVWQRLCLVYAETVEARNRLVHRQLEVDTDGSFIKLSLGPSRIDVQEQEALQALALRCSEVVLRQSCRARDKLILGWYLNVLGKLHGLAIVPASNEGPPIIVVVSARPSGPRWEFDAHASIYVLTKANVPDAGTSGD